MALVKNIKYIKLPIEAVLLVRSPLVLLVASSKGALGSVTYSPWGIKYIKLPIEAVLLVCSLLVLWFASSGGALVLKCFGAFGCQFRWPSGVKGPPCTPPPQSGKKVLEKSFGQVLEKSFGQTLRFRWLFQKVFFVQVLGFQVQLATALTVLSSSCVSQLPSSSSSFFLPLPLLQVLALALFSVGKLLRAVANAHALLTPTLCWRAPACLLQVLALALLSVGELLRAVANAHALLTPTLCWRVPVCLGFFLSLRFLSLRFCFARVFSSLWLTFYGMSVLSHSELPTSPELSTLNCQS